MSSSLRTFENAPLVFGRGALEHLAHLDGGRAAIVTDDGAMEDTGALGRAISYLHQAQFETRVVGRISCEPRMSDVDAAVPEMRAFDPDWIVALGGGSVMDCAKVLWARFEHSDMDWKTLFQFNRLPQMMETRLVAIPTTSGTGSETSRVAVIIDDSSGMKRLVFSREIIPTLAILDPDLPMTMPAHVAAASAFDALSHAIEASIATIASELTVANSLGAIRLIFKHLRRSCREADPHAREQVHYGATLAGMAINNATAGLTHGMDQIGPLFGVAHGVVCAVLLPYAMAYCLEAASGRFAEMGRAIGLHAESETELGWKFLRSLVELQRDVGLPLGVSQAGVPQDAFVDRLDQMVEVAMLSGSTQLSPRVPDQDELQDLYLAAFSGKLPKELIS